MALKNTSTGWGWLARLLHWTIAILMIGLLGVGFYMANFEKDLIKVYNLTQQHKSFGFTVFVLAVIRVIWRFSNRQTPKLPEAMPRWQVLASEASHWVLYILMFALPISGWLMSSASPFNDDEHFFTIKNMVFGLFEMPDPFYPGDQALTDFFHTIHMGCGFLLAGVLAIHTGAALKHHLFEKDRILMRMIIGR